MIAEKVQTAEKSVEELNVLIYHKIKEIEADGISVTVNPYWDLEDKNLLSLRIDTALLQ